MTSYNWIGNGSGTGAWNDPSNWNDASGNNGVPSSGDDANIANSDTITGDGLADTLTVSASPTFTGTITTTTSLYVQAGLTTVTSSGDLECSNSSGDAAATIEGELDVDGGTLHSDGGVNVQNFGTLDIYDAGTTDLQQSSGIYAALSIDSGGDVYVSDDGTTLDSGGISIGYTDEGYMSVDSGATVTATSQDPADFAGLGLAKEADTNGELDVGGGSTFTVASGGVSVGDEGDGTLNVEDSTFDDTDSSNGSMSLGAADGGSGTVDFDDSDVSIAQTLTVGDEGDATLTIENGSTVNVNALVVANGEDSGSDAARTATISDDGTTLTIADALIVGEAGTGTFSISDGATVSADSLDVAVEETSGSPSDSTASDLKIDGDGSMLTIKGDGSIGDAGYGTMELTDGATASFDSLDIAVQDSSGDADSTGDGEVSQVTLDGDQTALTVTDTLTVGDAGTGYMEVSGGATVTADSLIVAAQESSGIIGSDHATGGVTGAPSGIYLHDSGTSLSVDEDVTVGEGGFGYIDVWDGSAMSAASIDIAVEATSGDPSSDNESFIEVNNADSTLTVGGDVTVGDAGFGGFTVFDGSSATVGGDLDIGKQATSGTADAPSFAGVQDEGSSLKISGTTTVGDSGNGSLYIGAGGTFTAGGDNIEVGKEADSTGTVEIDSDTATFDYTGALTIGDAGTGTFDMEDGATWTAQSDITLGAQDTGDGTLDVMGDGSALTVDGTLTVGQDGMGTVNVDASDPAELTVQNLMTAAGTDSVAHMTIGSGDKSQASVTVKEATTIGQDGTATVTVDGGGGGTVSLTTSSLMMGSDEGSSGSLDVGADDGGEASVDVTDKMTIGGDGNATVTLGGMGLGDPGELTTPILMVAAGATSVSSFSIGKTGSTGTVSLTVSSDMTVGGAGTATVDMKSGTATVGGELMLGDEDGSNGTLSMSGDGTTFDASGGGVTIGDDGTGEIDVDDGSAFTAGGEVTLGSEDGSSGTLKVDGDGSSFDPPDMTVGSSGSGTVTLSNGGSLETGDLTLGEEDAGDGTVTVADADSSLTVDGDLEVGKAGQGTLVIDGDSTVSGETTIGSEADSNGQITVNGATLELDGETKVGESGTGTILVQQGGTLTAHEVTLGDKLGSSGTLTVDGDGTTMTTQAITVGSSGVGTLNVTDGAQLTSSDDSTLGDLASANVATATIDTQGLWSITGGLTVGGSGLAVMTIKGGGNVAATDDIVLGDQSGGASGEVDISGTSTDGSTPSGLGFGGTLQIGNGGTGTLKISGRALVAPTSGGKGLIEIAAQSGSTGSITVGGSGSELEGSTLAVGGTDTAAGGLGTLTVSDQGLVDVNDMTVWSSGAIMLAGGTLTTDPIAVDGGKISGYGSINGDITDDGLITASGGTLSLSGAVSGSGSLVVDAGSTLDVEGVSAGIAVSFDTSGTNEILGIGDPAGFLATVAGFVSGNTIDLEDIGYSSSDVATLLASNILQISYAGGDYDLHLDPSQNYSGDTFHLAADAANSGTDVTEIACYCKGTSLLTLNGEVCVETLAIGDRLMTAGGVYRAIKWIGKRSYGGRFVMGRKDILPICFRAGSIDENVPSRDLWVSPHHAMYLEGLLIEAKDLVNGVSIFQATHVERVEYFHVELDSHDVILAEGALSETFIDDDSRGVFHNAREYAALYPDERARPGRYYAPRLDSGFEVERIRQNIAAIAGIVTEPEASGPLHGFIDLINRHCVRGWAQNCNHPDVPVCLSIYDGKTLLGHVRADQYRPDLARAGLGDGRHAFTFRLPAGRVDASSNIAVTRALDGSCLAMTEKARTALTEGKAA